MWIYGYGRCRRLMRDLDEEKKEEVLSHIEDIEQAGDIVDLLKYDEDTAGG